MCEPEVAGTNPGDRKGCGFRVKNTRLVAQRWGSPQIKKKSYFFASICEFHESDLRGAQYPVAPTNSEPPDGQPTTPTKTAICSHPLVEAVGKTAPYKSSGTVPTNYMCSSACNWILMMS